MPSVSKERLQSERASNGGSAQGTLSRGTSDRTNISSDSLDDAKIHPELLDADDAHKYNGTRYIHPHDPRKVVWDLISMVFLIYNIIAVPLAFAFNLGFDLNEPGQLACFIWESIIGEQ